MSVNMEMVFAGQSTRVAFETMTQLGFDTFERWGIETGEVMRLRAMMQAAGTHMIACCPDTFVLNDPDAHDAYEASLLRALGVLRPLGCHMLITQVGQATARPRAAQHDAIVRGLRRAAMLLEGAGVTLLVEPLNDVRDHPGYYLTDSREGFEIIRAVNSPNVRLLYDIYHQLHMGEDVMARIDEGYDLIGHFHMAGFPNRDEGIFEGYDYRPLLDALHARGGPACLGIELRPSAPERVHPLLESLRAWR